LVNSIHDSTEEVIIIRTIEGIHRMTTVNNNRGEEVPEEE
jgi:hypothetical protein